MDEQQIQQEKLTLEKAGKIKKSKPLPPISDEEKPFDILDNWKWVSVGDVCTNIQYGTSKKSSSDSHEFLCAYYTASSDEESSKIRKHLEKHLPKNHISRKRNQKKY